jgi:hypothetical protein
MKHPAPQGKTMTTAISAPFGRPLPADLVAVQGAGRIPVIVHTLGSEKERADIGPRELAESTRQVLEACGYEGEWSIGGCVNNTEEAAHFATAGYTWQTFHLSGLLDWCEYALERLDTAIVTLEDSGCYPLGWHELYLEKDFAISDSFAIRLDDVELAKVAVRYARFFSEAEQMQQAVRASTVGLLPDIEIHFAAHTRPCSESEFFFVCSELRRRGIDATVVTPFINENNECGYVNSAQSLTNHAMIAAKFDMKLGMRSMHAASNIEGHIDATESAILATLAILAKQQPGLFRQWLDCARECYPVARLSSAVSTDEGDVRFLPDVKDSELEVTFLDTLQGRQLLLATWPHVLSVMGKTCKFQVS